MTTHIRHNKGVSDKVLIEDFSKRKFQQEKYLKSLTQKRLNKGSLDYFENYKKHVIDPKYFFLTIRFDVKIMSYLLPSRRLDFVEKVYEEIKHRMHTKVGIKNYKRIKPHFDKYEYLHRIQETVEVKSKYGNDTDPHYHLICAMHPAHHKKINRRYWESVVDSPHSFLFGSTILPFSYYDAIHSLNVQEIKIPFPLRRRGLNYYRDQSNLKHVIDYVNKEPSLVSFSTEITKEASNATTHPIRRAG